MIGDWLYALTPRDAQLPRLEVIRSRGLKVQTATSITIEIFPQPQHALIVQNIHLRCIAGAGQTVSSFFLDVRDAAPATAAAFIVEEQGLSVSSVARTLTSLSLIVVPGKRLFLEGFFSAGTNANQVSLNVLGYVVPRGNIGEASLLGDLLVS